MTAARPRENRGSACPSLSGLTPPFAADWSLVEANAIVLPAAVRTNMKLARPEQNIEDFLQEELYVRKLEAIHGYLWLAGLPIPARSLIRQKLLNRTLMATDQVDEHLVWHEDRIFLKPLPDFLLCHGFWEQHICADSKLHASACGLLLSWIWLISSAGDFQIAHKECLIPSTLEDYSAWTRFASNVLDHIDQDSPTQFHRRYRYGELRLSRLHWIVQLAPSPLWSPRTFVNGYMNTPTWYAALFRRNFGWLVIALAYISIILSALQVGLAVDQFEKNPRFVNLSYGLVIASLAFVFAGIVTIIVVWASLFWFHLLSTLHFVRKIRMQREEVRRKTA